MAKRTKTNRIFTIVLAVILGIGILTAGVFLFKPKESKRIYPTYHVGSIDENGKYVESDDSIYSDKFECQGLKIEPNFSTNVSFSVYYYRFDDSLVRCDTKQTQTYEAKDSDVIRYARIVITPDKGEKDPDDYKIRFWNISGIANDVKVFVNTKQKELKNFAEVKEKGKWSDNGTVTDEWKKLVEIDVKDINTLAFVFEDGVDKLFESVMYQFGDDAPTTGENYIKAEDVTSKIYKLDVSSKDNKIYISIKDDVSLKIYKYE